MMSEQALGVFELLLAENWLEKCAIAQQYAVYLPCIRDTLEEESYLALRRGDTDDAFVFAAHVELLNDIERCGVVLARARIAQAMKRCGHPTYDDSDDYAGNLNW